MDKKQYLNTVTEQIRYRKAKFVIAEELENHIDDQKDAYCLGGMEEQEAYEQAVAEMGDPVEVGVSLDRIHRPKMEWKMIALVLGISILGVFFQFVIQAEMGSEAYPYNLRSQILNVGIGFFVMISFCIFDYTRIGMAGRSGAIVLLALLLLSFTNGSMINGQLGYLRFTGVNLNMHLLMYLYIPFFGGLLYFYREQGKRGFSKVVFWMLLPVLIILRLPDLSLASALLLIMLLQTCYVLKKGWYGLEKKGLTIMISIVIGLPVLILVYLMFFSAAYQRARILALFSSSNDYNYQLLNARNVLQESQFVGRSTEGVTGLLPEVPSAYIITYIFSYYGILTAILVIAVLGFFIIKNFRISLQQKNQLGLVTGMGCSLVFAVQIILYIMVNLTIAPSTSVFLPFLSYGGTGTVVSFALTGILLSIYRYQNVLPVNPNICFRKQEKL